MYIFRVMTGIGFDFDFHPDLNERSDRSSISNPLNENSLMNRRALKVVLCRF
jgi:hypothetical protein